jgi:hypothetical protein
MDTAKKTDFRNETGFFMEKPKKCEIEGQNRAKMPQTCRIW